MKLSKSKTSTGWTRARIKYELEERGYSFAEIARKFGYTCPTTPADVLRRPYPVMERIVANLVGVRPKTIWPERYDVRGCPLHGRGRVRAAR